MAKARQVTKYRDSLRTERRKHLRNRVLLGSSVLAILVAGIAYLLFFARLFDVRHVAVASDNQAGELKDPIKAEINQWLDSKQYLLQRRRNIFLLSTRQLQLQLTQDFPKIDAMTISRHLTHGLRIDIKERSPEGIWCLTQLAQCFYFSETGIIYEKSPQTAGFLILTIRDNRDKTVNLGEKIAPDDWLKAIEDARRKLIEKKFKIKTIVIPQDSLADFYILTSTNLKILLSVDTDIESQIDAMSSFLVQKLTADKLSQLQYVDLRIQDRIYYK